MSLRVGEVIAVNGIKVTLRIEEESSKDTLFFNGDTYKGISIREYVLIQRGFRDIVCIIEGEYLDENKFNSSDGKVEYIRKVEVKPIGYFESKSFFQGIKYMPMIKDSAYLLSEVKISAIYDRGDKNGNFKIGTMLKEGIHVNLPWKKMFNSHIGIFGNTGSGKSNTLTKLYTVLFEEKTAVIGNKSKFIILDFNGEYVGDQLVANNHKTIYNLSTQATQQLPQGHQRLFPLSSDEFWDIETLSLLFQATTNTQRPFLNRIIEGRKRFANVQNSLNIYTKKKIASAFNSADCKPATLDLVRSIARLLGHQQLIEILDNISYHSGQGRFWGGGTNFYDANGNKYNQTIFPTVDTIDTAQLDSFEELILRALLQLIGDLISGYVQFDHIQPLLKRVDSSFTSLRKVLAVGNAPPPETLLTIISLRKCNNEVKKVLPLLFAKYYYHSHKATVATPPDKTIHLIIDEAHNILSQQSVRESENWKDYRLEQFEEIIKEGRKFGIFITVSSQRPADISPTIVSQLHNFFIHRLVNDRDLFLIDNTITTLDSMSRSLIPNLAQGCCVVTGTAFDLPMVLQIDKLDKAKQPSSEDVDLEELWKEEA